MMIKIVALLKRRDGMSKEEFRKYYEEKHLLLCYEHVRGIAVDYRRNYIEDIFGSGGENEFSDSLGSTFGYDVVTEVWFKSREALQQLFKKLEDSSLTERMVKDEPNLFDRSAHRFMICEEVITDPSFLR
jgi:hypothetical protein